MSLQNKHSRTQALSRLPDRKITQTKIKSSDQNVNNTCSIWGGTWKQWREWNWQSGTRIWLCKNMCKTYQNSVTQLGTVLVQWRLTLLHARSSITQAPTGQSKVWWLHARKMVVIYLKRINIHCYWASFVVYELRSNSVTSMKPVFA